MKNRIYFLVFILISMVLFGFRNQEKSIIRGVSEKNEVMILEKDGDNVHLAIDNHNSIVHYYGNKQEKGNSILLFPTYQNNYYVGQNRFSHQKNLVCYIDTTEWKSLLSSNIKVEYSLNKKEYATLSLNSGFTKHELNDDSKVFTRINSDYLGFKSISELEFNSGATMLCMSSKVSDYRISIKVNKDSVEVVFHNGRKKKFNR